MTIPIQHVAHRGGAALAPQNTLAAFRHALTLPAVDAIEIDVHMSRDGHAIVFHDYTVEALTDGRGNILDLDFAYLRSLNAAAHFPGGWSAPQQIPTLCEALDLARGHASVYIEIKQSRRDGVYGRYPGIAEAVMQEVQAAGMLDQVLLISFDWMVLPEVKALASSVQTGALVSADTWNSVPVNALATLMDQVSALGCNWINMDRRLFSAAIAHTAHQRGFKLGLWTVNELADMRRFASEGVDSLTSDRPDLFADI